MMQVYFRTAVVALALSVPAAQVFSEVEYSIAERALEKATRASAVVRLAVSQVVAPTGEISPIGRLCTTASCAAPAPLPAPLSVSTNPAVVLPPVSVRLAAQAGPADRSLTGWFRYDTVRPTGCTDSFGQRTPAQALAASAAPSAFMSDVAGLAPGATYYYCALVSDGVNLAWGSLLSFTVPGTLIVEKPDLTVANLALVQPTSAPAQYLAATIKNIGTAPLTQTVGLNLYGSSGALYPVSLLYSASAPLGPGASVTVTGPAATAGTVTYRAIVDPAHTVDELQEQNNELSQPLTLTVSTIRITLVRVAGVTSRAAVVTWHTSSPATGQVQFDAGSAISSSSAIQPDTSAMPLTVEHSVQLTNLLPDQHYVFRTVGQNSLSETYTSDVQSFTTVRAGQDLPDLAPLSFSQQSLARNYAGYPFNGDNVTLTVRNASPFDAGTFGVWLVLRDVATKSLQCAPAIVVNGLAGNRSKAIDFGMNSFLRCPLLEAKQYYLEVAVDQSPVAGVSQVAELNETNNTRVLPPFSVNPAAGAPRFTNFILRPDSLRARRTRLEFDMNTPLTSALYRPVVYYFAEPTDGIFSSLASLYTHHVVPTRDVSGRYMHAFDNVTGVRYHVRVVEQRTNVVSDDIVVVPVP